MDTARKQFDRRREALKQERSSWFGHWQELSDHILPRRGRFLGSDRNRGTKKNSRIINNTATLAVRTLSSGMMAGITSPARPWFRLATPDPDMMEFGPVKAFLHAKEELMRLIFARSNLYNVLHTAYDELGVFGTGPILVEKDFEDVIRAYPFTAGEYLIANDSKLVVNSIYREYSMTVAQVVAKFSPDGKALPKNISATVRNLWDKGNYDAWVDLVHLIEPHTGKLDGLPDISMPWRSVTYEVGQEDGDKFLRVSGYEEFPVMAPRWHVTGTDVYGRSPGMDALGDVKALQVEEKRKAEAIEKLVRPPMKGPGSLKNRPASILPGDITYVDVQQGQQGFEPVYQVNPRVNELMMDIQAVEDRIKRAFYADLFLMLAQSDRRQMTATEVAERHEEKLLMLGPVLERLQAELLSPLIDRTWAIMARAGLLDDAPDELRGIDLKVEFVSLLSQAQQMAGTGAIERMAGFVGNLAAANPEVLDKIDFDQAVDEYGTMLGVPPSMIRSDDDVAKMRAQRRSREQAAQAAALMQQAADGAKTLSETEIRGETLLNTVMGGAAA